MRRTLAITTALIAVTMCIPPAQAANSITGSYLISDGLSWSLIDACELGYTNGVDSSCVALPANFPNAVFTLSVVSSTGTVTGLQACFYKSDGSFISPCQQWTGTVPSLAARAGISSLSGMNVAWKMSI